MNKWISDRELLEAVKKDEQLSTCLCPTCEENEMAAVIDGRVPTDDFIIIKVDDYYNRFIHPAPPSPDCLILQKCQNGKFALTVVELKNIRHHRGFRLIHIIRKFQTCLERFMSRDFKSYFDRDYQRLRLIFVTDINFYGREKGLSLKLLLDTRFKFRSRNYIVMLRKETALVKPCY